MAYWRSDQRFFSDPDTKSALTGLTRTNHLVLYCGAGVTRDQTDLEWAEMLAEAFQVSEDDVKALDKWGMSFPAIASALTESADDEARTYLPGHLRKALYRAPKATVWGGDLVRRVAQLCLIARLVQSQVTVITSNYDDYIETQVRALLDEMGKELDLPEINLLSEDDLDRMHPVPDDQVSIRVLHVHGRIPRYGKPSERLVLTEEDYARDREACADVLREYLSQDGVGLAIVGSSITDPPLVDALASTKGTVRSTRVALWALEPSGMYEDDRCSELLQLFKARARHIGLDLLTPDFLRQIPQFFFELAVAIAEDDPKAFLEGEDRYGMRLVTWWDGFISRYPESDASGTLHGRLRQLLREIEAVLNEPGTWGEDLRLDLWVRRDPDHARELTLWASSSALLVEHSAHKSEGLYLGNSHATVIGFLRGRPTSTDLTDIGWPKAAAARWQSFLVVPIDALVNEYLTPIGAVTLCSTQPLDKCAFGKTKLDNHDQKTVIDLMRKVLPNLPDV